MLDFTPELITRFVTRPEDFPHNIASSIQQYKDMLLRNLEVRNSHHLKRLHEVNIITDLAFVFMQDYMADHDQQKLIELDANLPLKTLFKVSV